MRLVRPAGSPPPRTASSPEIPVSSRGGTAITTYSTSQVTVLINYDARQSHPVTQLSQGRCRSLVKFTLSFAPRHLQEDLEVFWGVSYCATRKRGVRTCGGS